MIAETTTKADLFLRGAKRYLDALAAVEAFEREVQEICTDVYKRYATDFSKQMGLDAAGCEPYTEPRPAERYAEVGVSRPAQKDCTLCVYLAWDEANSGQVRIRGAITLGLYHKGLRDSLYERFRQENPHCRVEKHETYMLLLRTEIKPDEIESAGKVLDDLALEWLGYCESIDGLGLKKLKTP